MEQGTHKQLMALPEGGYAALAKMQMGTPPSSPLTKQDLEAETDKETAAGTPDTPISPQQSLEKQVSIHSKRQQSAKVQNGNFLVQTGKNCCAEVTLCMCTDICERSAPPGGEEGCESVHHCRGCGTPGTQSAASPGRRSSHPRRAKGVILPLLSASPFVPVKVAQNDVVSPLRLLTRSQRVAAGRMTCWKHSQSFLQNKRLSWRY